MRGSLKNKALPTVWIKRRFVNKWKRIHLFKIKTRSSIRADAAANGSAAQMFSKEHLLLLLLLLYFRFVKNFLSEHRLFFFVKSSRTSNQRRWDWWDMLYAWERREMCTGIWLDNLKERGCLQDVGVDGRTCWTGLWGSIMGRRGVDPSGLGLTRVLRAL